MATEAPARDRRPARARARGRCARRSRWRSSRSPTPSSASPSTRCSSSAPSTAACSARPAGIARACSERLFELTHLAGRRAGARRRRVARGHRAAVRDRPRHARGEVRRARPHPARLRRRRRRPVLDGLRQLGGRRDRVGAGDQERGAVALSALEILDPTAEREPTGRPLAARGDGRRTIALLDIRKPRGRRLPRRARARCCASAATTVAARRRSRPSPSRRRPTCAARSPQRCDAVIEALAD